MANIFYKEFIRFYRSHNIPFTYKKCEKRTYYNYFELHDIKRDLQISNVKGNYSSKINNPKRCKLVIFDFDKFLTPMPRSIEHGKGRCDAIIYTECYKDYFILNELKDRENLNKNQRKAIRKTAKDQLVDTLEIIFSVPNIELYVNSFAHRVCISSNAKPYTTVNTSPIISGTLNSFNMGRSIKGGSKLLSHSRINLLNFDYYDIFGDEVFDLT